jgi:hypothetical protein
LNDPFNDPFPTDASDARLSNDDNDDRVAVSVHLPLGRRIDFAARFITAIGGTLGGDGAWTGSVTTGTVRYDFTVFGDNIPLVDARADAQETIANNVLISQTTKTALVPLRGGASCADALNALKSYQ